MKCLPSWLTIIIPTTPLWFWILLMVSSKSLCWKNRNFIKKGLQFLKSIHFFSCQHQPQLNNHQIESTENRSQYWFKNECTLTDSWFYLLYLLSTGFMIAGSLIMIVMIYFILLFVFQINVLLLFTTKGNCIKWGPGLYCMHYGNMGCGVFKRGVQN